MPSNAGPVEYPFLVWESFHRDEAEVSAWHFERPVFDDFVKWLQAKPYMVDGRFCIYGATYTLIGVCLAVLNVHIAAFAKLEWKYWTKSLIGRGAYDTVLGDICHDLERAVTAEIERQAE